MDNALFLRTKTFWRDFCTEIVWKVHQYRLDELVVWVEDVDVLNWALPTVYIIELNDVHVSQQTSDRVGVVAYEVLDLWYDNAFDCDVCRFFLILDIDCYIALEMPELFGVIRCTNLEISTCWYYSYGKADLSAVASGIHA